MNKLKTIFWIVLIGASLNLMAEQTIYNPEDDKGTSQTSNSTNHIVDSSNMPINDNTTQLQGVKNPLKYLKSASCPTDFNGDGITDGEDFGIFLGNFNLTCTDCPTDLNTDNITNGEDFGIFLGNFGLICSDADGDGFTIAEGDCNDADPNIFPGSVEICGDGIINTCESFCSESEGLSALADSDLNTTGGLSSGVGNNIFTLTTAGSELYLLNSDDLSTNATFQGTGFLVGSPVYALLSNNIPSIHGVFVAQFDGLVRRVSSSSSNTSIWSIDIRRAGCGTDGVEASLSDVHVHEEASNVFQSVYREIPGDDTSDGIDIVYCGTSYGCGTITANRVYALNAVNGSSLWAFNDDGAQDMDAVRSKPILDIQSDRLYVGPDRTSATQHSLFSIDVLTGELDWSANYGSIWSAPQLKENRIFVGNLDGDFYAVNKTDGSQIWSLPTGLPILQAPFVEQGTNPNPRIAFVDFFGAITLIQDMGSSASLLWSTPLPVDVYATSAPIFFPESEMLYVGADDGRVYQMSMIDGSITASRLIEAGSSVTGVTFAPETIDCGGISDERILVTTDVGVIAKFCHPWVSE